MNQYYVSYSDALTEEGREVRINIRRHHGRCQSEARTFSHTVVLNVSMSIEFLEFYFVVEWRVLLKICQAMMYLVGCKRFKIH